MQNSLEFLLDGSGERLAFRHFSSLQFNDIRLARDDRLN